MGAQELCLVIWAYVSPGWVYRVCLTCAGGVYSFKRRGGYVSFCSFLYTVHPLKFAGWFPPQRTLQTSLDRSSGGIGLSSGHRRIWRISVWGGNNLWCDRLCGLVVRVLGYRSGGPGSFPGTTRFSEGKKNKGNSSGSGTGSAQPREYNWGATW
jgi:hypothetical protein